jgi:hypothetical protein
MKKLFFVIVLVLNCVLISVRAPSQNKNFVSVKNCCSIVQLHDEITLADAKKKAIFGAKMEALSKAGVSNSIKSTSLLTTEQMDHANFSQSFFEVLTDEMEGVVVDHYIVKEERYLQNGLLSVEICIDAYVRLYQEKRDPAFTFEITGIKEIYYHDDLLSFSFIPHSNGYLRIFLFEEESAQLIYPNFEVFGEQPDHLFKAGKTHSFPLNSAFQYPLVAAKPEVFHQLVFIFTKFPLPVLQNLSQSSISRQIYSLPRDQVRIQSSVYKLKQNR